MPGYLQPSLRLVFRVKIFNTCRPLSFLTHENLENDYVLVSRLSETSMAGASDAFTLFVLVLDYVIVKSVGSIHY